jgi:ankyrin repeat protein
MVDIGFDPRAPGQDGGSALHCAAWDGSAETVAVLLRRPDAQSLIAIRDARYNATPLGWCCHGSRFGNTSHDHAGVARLLLEAGARPEPGTREASAAVEAVLGNWRKVSDESK